MKSETSFGKMLEQYYDSGVCEFDKYDVGELISLTGEARNKECDSCFAGDGTPKNTYNTKHEAETQADIIYEESGIYLRSYSCKNGGWHLTKAL